MQRPVRNFCNRLRDKLWKLEPLGQMARRDYKGILERENKNEGWRYVCFSICDSVVPYYLTCSLLLDNFLFLTINDVICQLYLKKKEKILVKTCGDNFSINEFNTYSFS